MSLGTLSRRSVLAGFSTQLALAVTSHHARGQVAGATCGIKPRRYKPDAKIAVSLRSLVNALPACKPNGQPTGRLPGFSFHRCKGFLTLGGITRLEGIILDEAARDIILWGAKEEGVADVFADDLIVALRHAYGYITQVVDGKSVRYSPAISIDADGDVFDRLRRLKGDWKKTYATICQSPMKVRVEGMPRHTRAAAVLVEADYLMKKVNFGVHRLPISNPFMGEIEMQWAVQSRQNAIGVKQVASSTRWWFTAGAFDYQTTPTNDEFFLETAQLLLNTASTRNKGGDLVDTGEVDEFSQSYACIWNERMDEVIASEPIWRDMQNVYRHFAIANLIAENQLLERVGLLNDTLFKTYNPAFVKVQESLPGVYHFSDDGSRAVCGGVSVQLTERNMARNASSDDARLASNAVLRSRPFGGDGGAWPVVR